MARWLGLLVMVLAGCASAPASATPAPATTTAPLPSLARPITAPSAPSPPLPLTELLPTQLAGVELHTFVVGQDIVARLAERLGSDVDRIEVRNASEHGARFFQTYAVRLAGTDGSVLLDAWSDVAYPPEIADVTVNNEDIGGHSVTVVNSPSAAARLGTFYAYERADTLLVVQASDPEVAAEVLLALP